MEPFAAYGHAIVALALIGLMGLIMSPIVGRQKAALGLPPGADPVAEYSSSVYRWHRAYLNLSESTGFFVAVTVAAILAGAAPFWVNLLASGYVLARVLMAVIHVGGLGKANVSLRSFAFASGWLISIILAVMAILGVFIGG